ncbi:MAG: hypothetical protein ACRERV_04330 [Methylococcales bacterium]
MQLTNYDHAPTPLQAVVTLDEAKQIKDQSEALAHYARQRNDVDTEIWVAEIKMRAARRIGEISKGLETNERARADLRSSGGTQTKTESLKQAEISKTGVIRYEKLAEIPEADFETADQGLAEAKTIQDTKTVMDASAAAEVYARRQNLSDEISRKAHSIKIYAMAKLGQKLKDMPKSEGS